MKKIINSMILIAAVFMLNFAFTGAITLQGSPIAVLGGFGLLIIAFSKD